MRMCVFSCKRNIVDFIIRKTLIVVYFMLILIFLGYWIVIHIFIFLLSFLINK